MAATSRYLTFEGQYEGSVLGTFRIIRGFAELQTLAEISVPFDMEESEAGDDALVIGQQRKIDPEHAERIKNYLQNGDQRFLPEVILSVRAELIEEIGKSGNRIGVKNKSDDDGISIGRISKNEGIKLHRIRIEKKKLDDIRKRRLIRRVDGNHRLAHAESLEIDAANPSKFLAPFCIVLMGSPDHAADDYSESLIFHTINSTALPLESEHALRLILGQDSEYSMKPEREFLFSPDLHFTRLLRDGLLKLPKPAQERIGNRPLTSLRGAAVGLLAMDPSIAEDLSSLRKAAKELLSALDDIATKLEASQPSLCKAEFFIELAARVWSDTSRDGDYKARVDDAVAFLNHLAIWLGRDGLVELKEAQSLSKQILDIYSVIRSRIPRRVFLARWYPTEHDGIELKKSQLRLKQIQVALKEFETELGTSLSLVDMGTQEGATFPIHQEMYNAIASADIILIDLTGARPNVCVEAGYALRHHERNRLIFLFQSTEAVKAPPFDLNTFRYELITDAAEIPEKLKPNLAAILKDAKVGI